MPLSRGTVLKYSFAHPVECQPAFTLINDIGIGSQGTARKPTGNPTSHQNSLYFLAQYRGFCLASQAPRLPTCEQHEPGQQEEGSSVEERVGPQES